MVTNMKHENTSKKLSISPEAMEEALATAPEQTEHSSSRTDWDNAVVTRSKEELKRAVRRFRGKNKLPTKEQVSVRYSPEVLEYFRSTGKGWQTRMDDVLRHYVADQGTEYQVTRTK